MCWGRTASTESYLKEIVTFHIDRLMGFNYDHDLVLHESQQALDDIKLWMHVIVAAARNANSIGGGFLRTFQDPDDKFVRPVSSKPAFNDTTAIDYEYLRDCMTDDDFLRPVRYTTKHRRCLLANHLCKHN